MGVVLLCDYVPHPPCTDEGVRTQRPGLINLQLSVISLFFQHRLKSNNYLIHIGRVPTFVIPLFRQDLVGRPVFMGLVLDGPRHSLRVYMSSLIIYVSERVIHRQNPTEDERCFRYGTYTPTGRELRVCTDFRVESKTNQIRHFLFE